MFLPGRVPIYTYTSRSFFLRSRLWTGLGYDEAGLASLTPSAVTFPSTRRDYKSPAIKTVVRRFDGPCQDALSSQYVFFVMPANTVPRVARIQFCVQTYSVCRFSRRIIIFDGMESLVVVFKRISQTFIDIDFRNRPVCREKYPRGISLKTIS